MKARLMFEITIATKPTSLNLLSNNSPNITKSAQCGDSENGHVLVKNVFLLKDKILCHSSLHT